MKLFFAYLFAGGAWLPLAFLGLSTLVFWLYGVPLYALCYALALCAALYAAVFAVGFSRFVRRHRLLARIGSDARACVDLLPEPRSPVEADYQALVRGAVDAWAKALSDADARYGERIGYYTLWAHQIKTPIAAMRLLLAEQDTPQARALLLELSRVERYVEMALCYLRLDSDSTDYVFAPCALEPLMRACARSFAPQFISGRLRLNLEATDAVALTDEKWLAFMLEQLLSNAIKYTPPGGEITVGVREGPVLFVKDTGAGIAPDELPRIFEQGFTGRLGREDKRATGLGLYLCGRIAKGLGHTIRCESAPGQGTRMEIGLRSRPVGAE